jgi:hypothetical protein
MLEAARAAYAGTSGRVYSNPATTTKAAAPDRTYELSDDIEGFEARVDCFRRYAVAAIRDRSTQGDRVAVKVGRKMFLLVCEQGVEAAEEVGNHAYAAMLQRQCEEFRRALSDQAAPSSEESGLLPSHPVDSDADVRSMPSHELIIGYFVSCAAEGMPFFEAMDSLWGSRPPDADTSDRASTTSS